MLEITKGIELGIGIVIGKALIALSALALIFLTALVVYILKGGK